MPVVMLHFSSADDVAEEWKAQYFDSGVWMRTMSGDSEQVYRKLKALGPKATYRDVDAIIGNESWTQFFCDECHEYAREAVQLGEEPDYESATVRLCISCFYKAVLIVRETTGIVVD